MARDTLRAALVGASMCAAVAAVAVAITVGSDGYRGTAVSTHARAASASTQAARAPTEMTAPGIPGDQQLLRTKTLTGPNGESVTINWYGTPSYGPRYTTNLTVGPDAGSRWLSQQDSVAGQLTTTPDGSALEPSSVSHPTINGVRGIAYTDMIGWSSVSWSPRSDVVLSVTGFQIPAMDMVRIAQGVTTQ
jgi:hypothetical protein